MVSPTVTSVTTGLSGSNQTSTSIPRPSGAVAGQLVIVLHSRDGYSGTTGTSTPGWAVLDSAARSFGDTLTVLHGIDGSVTWPLVLTHPSEQRTWHVLLIDGADSTPYISSATTGSQNDLIDPAELAPGLGVRDYLWIAVADTNHGARAIGAAPPGYEGFESTAVGTGSGTTVAHAYRTSSAVSEDPGSFPSPGSTYVWVAFTIGVAGADAPVSPFSLWDGATESPLTLDGIWDGVSVTPALFDTVI